MVLGYLLNSMLGVLSYIVPKRKGFYVIGSMSGTHFFGNSKYLFLYMVPDHDIEWLTTSRSVEEKIRGFGLPVRNISTLKAFWRILRAEVLIIDDSVRDVSYANVLLGRFKILQLWHGILLKKAGFDVEKGRNRITQSIYDKITYRQNTMMTVLATSTENARIMNRVFRGAKVAITGYPRNDVLIDEQRAVESLSEKLALEQYTRRYLYVPTFRDDATEVKPFSAEFLNRINKWLKDQNSVLLVKKHPHDNALVVPSLSNIRDVSRDVDDLQELLVRTDVLISDYSGAALDFVITGRPVLSYIYDYEHYQSTRGLYYDLLEALPGPFARDQEELYHLITNPTKDEKTYDRTLGQFHTFRDAESSARVVEVLRKL